MVRKNSQHIPYFHEAEVCHSTLGSHFCQAKNSNSFSRQVYTPVLASEANPICKTAMASWENNIPSLSPPPPPSLSSRLPHLLYYQIIQPWKEKLEQFQDNLVVDFWHVTVITSFYKFSSTFWQLSVKFFFRKRWNKVGTSCFWQLVTAF